MNRSFVFFALVVACSGTNAANNTNQTPDAAVTTVSGLPCDVATVLAKCTTCHSKPPNSDAPMSLVSRDDLAAPFSGDPSKTVAQRAVERMISTTSPMPPKPAEPATGADISTLQAWIDQGMPPGECDGTTVNPFDTPVACTSGKSWTLGDRGSASMHPGKACITCHKTKFDAPKLIIGGTVYPSANEPDDCVSVPSATTQVVITDANKKVYTLPVNSSGNFRYESLTTTFKMPYTAKVVSGGKERVMVGARDDGDCNRCHTQDGTEGAPGRILFP